MDLARELASSLVIGVEAVALAVVEVEVVSVVLEFVVLENDLKFNNFESKNNLTTLILWVYY